MPTNPLDDWIAQAIGVNPADFEGTDGSTPGESAAQSAPPDAATGTPPGAKTDAPPASGRPVGAPPPPGSAPTQSGAGNPGDPMPADCVLQHNMVDGPSSHMLCSKHGHVVDTDKKIIITRSVADYDALFHVPRKLEDDCEGIPGKMPQAPPNIMLCKHGHVIDTAAKKIVANTPAMFGRAQVPGGTAPAPPTPPPSPTPTPPSPPTPPPPPPAPDPFPKGTFAHSISAQQLGDLASLLKDMLVTVHIAEGDADSLHADMKTNKLDSKNMADVAKRLQAGLQSVDKEALKTLQNAKAIMDEASDGLAETQIELENAGANLHALKKLRDLPDLKDSKDKLDAIDEQVKQYDLAVNIWKAEVDIVSSPNPFGVIQAVLEIAGSDKLKGSLQDHLTKVIGLEDSMLKDMTKLVDSLRALGREETEAEAKRQEELTTLLSDRVRHFETASNNFVHDLNTLPPRKGGAVSPDMKAIMDIASRVTTVSHRMKQLVGVVQKSKSLNDSELRAALDPLGTFDADFTKHVQQSVPTGLVYENTPRRSLFILPPTVDQAALEKMPGQVQDVLQIKTVSAQMADEERDWDSTMDSEFAADPAPVKK